MIMTGLIDVISTTDKAQVKRNGHKYGELTAACICTVVS